MADEKKLSLSDLGIEDDNDSTNNEKVDITIAPANTSEDQPPISNVTVSKPIDGPVVNAEKPKRKIVTPHDRENALKKMEDEKLSKIQEAVTETVHDSSGATYKEIKNINAFLGRKPKEKVDPVRKTLDTLYDKVDKNIDRTKKDLIRPGGRIDEAKRKYVEWKYPKLMVRAQNNKRLQAMIDKVNQIIDTDPRFDGISDYERKAYILFVVSKDKNTGVDNDYFGIEEVKNTSAPRNSNDNIKAIDDIIKETESLGIDFSDDGDDDFLSLGTNDKSTSIKVDKKIKPEKVSVDEEETTTIPDASEATVDDKDEKLDSDNIFLTEDADEKEDSVDEDVDDIGVSEEEIKANQKEFREELIQKLRLDRTDDLEGFTVSTKPIAINKALKPKHINSFSYTWPLLYTGIGAEITPLNGDEIINLNPSNTNFETVKGLNTIFSILYRHIINPNKAPFETWLRQTSDYDIDGIIFGAHAATFKDTNYLTYECTNKKCKHIFLQKKSIMDMVVFPNDETKERFNSILDNDDVMSQTYKSATKRINEDYAIGFVSQSIYSNLFEPASLPSDFTKKYAPIISLMPNIDKIYRIDNANKQLIPINFGVVENSLSKTVQRKVKSIYTILQSFTPDERSIVVAEAQKITNQLDKWKITYAIPETVCPKCGQKIERQESNPLNILFTRAQLPIVAAYIQE